MNTFNIHTGRLFRLFGAATLLLIFSGIISAFIRANYDIQYIFRSVDMFDLNHENNIPTWYASVGFISCALGAFLISRVPLQLSQSFQWKSLAVIFLLMSLDEKASLHEYGASLMKGQFEFKGYWYFAWVLPGIVLIFEGWYIFSASGFNYPAVSVVRWLLVLLFFSPDLWVWNCLAEN